MGPANRLWGKQYDVYAKLDTAGQRYLDFLVDKLFIGDTLSRGQVKSSSGETFDRRTITLPIIVFASAGDTISPTPARRSSGSFPQTKLMIAQHALALIQP